MAIQLRLFLHKQFMLLLFQTVRRRRLLSNPAHLFTPGLLYRSVARLWKGHRCRVNYRMLIATAIRAIIILEIQVNCLDELNLTGFRIYNDLYLSGDRITQPTYVNMYELATMAASKAQEHFPPPPPEDCVPNETSFHNEKVSEIDPLTA